VAHGRIITKDVVQMAELVFGDIESGPVLGGVIIVSSPLRYGERMSSGLITFARLGQVVLITPFIMAGAMVPITIPAALAQQNAEALAGIALVQLVRAGAPVIYGGFTTTVDMRFGSPAFGTPEGAWAGITLTPLIPSLDSPVPSLVGARGSPGLRYLASPGCERRRPAGECDLEGYSCRLRATSFGTGG